MKTPSASYSFTIRLQIANRPGMLGRVASAIGDAGGDIGAVDLVETTRERTLRDMTVKARDSIHAQQIVSRLRHVAGVRIGHVSDRTFLMHLGGKIEVRNKIPIRTRDDLSMAYTPGVARVCLAIRDDRQRAFSLTIKQNTVAVVTDGQHGTAVVVLAALLNALRIVKRDLRRIRVVVTGVGAAGTATIKILQSSGVRDIIGVDEHGTIYRGREQGMDFMKRWVAAATNPRQVKGTLGDALKGAAVFIGLSVPGILTVKDIKRMARDPIVFAMANPEPEIRPEEAERHVRVMATGRSDYPNQINNVLCFPGFFRGLLDSRARVVNVEMKVAAARALAARVSRSELSEEYIIPSVFNKGVAPAVAEGVVRAAHETSAARRRRPLDLSAIP